MVTKISQRELLNGLNAVAEQLKAGKTDLTKAEARLLEQALFDSGYLSKQGNTRGGEWDGIIGRHVLQASKEACTDLNIDAKKGYYDIFKGLADKLAANPVAVDREVADSTGAHPIPQTKAKLNSAAAVTKPDSTAVHKLDSAAVHKPTDVLFKNWSSSQPKPGTINSLATDEEKVIAWRQTQFQSGANKHNYIIVDKKKAQAHVLNAEGKKLLTVEVGLGADIGDGILSENRKMTTAGIYTINGKGTGHDAFASTYGDQIFTMTGTKGVETGVALHQIPLHKKSRYQYLGDENLANNRFSQGCVNFDTKDIKKLEKLIDGVGTNVYILPEDSNNYFTVRQGELVFASKQFDPLVHTSPKLKYQLNQNEAYPLKISVNKDNSHTSTLMRVVAPTIASVKTKIEHNTASVFAETLSEQKRKLMSDLKLDNDAYNELARTTLAIASQESDMGTSWRYGAKVLDEAMFGLRGWIKQKFDNNSFDSQGITQVKFGSFADKQTKALFDRYGITEDNLSDPEKSAQATMIVLAGMYHRELPSLDKHIEKLKMGTPEALMYLWNNRRHEIVNETATPSKNVYVKTAMASLSDNFTFQEASHSYAQINKSQSNKSNVNSAGDATNAFASYMPKQVTDGLKNVQVLNTNTTTGVAQNHGIPDTLKRPVGLLAVSLF